MWLAVGEKKKQTNLEASYRLHMYMATLKYLLTCHAWNTSHWICFLLHMDKVKKLAFKLASKTNGLTHNLWRVWINYAISAQKICKMCCIEGKLETSMCGQAMNMCLFSLIIIQMVKYLIVCLLILSHCHASKQYFDPCLVLLVFFFQETSSNFFITFHASFTRLLPKSHK